ncbi:MAG: site-specific integrase [Puniceicoccales bacterium]|jgi:integrase|nr:site-specific integrase [Puniceicoccales bacterium]
MKKPNKSAVFRFTKMKLSNAKPPSKGVLILHDMEESTLKAHVTPKGNVIFYYRNTINGIPHRESLGTHGHLTIDEARIMANRLKLAHVQGLTLSEKFAQDNGDLSFQEGFHEFMERYSRKEKRSWKDDDREIKKHVRHWFERKMKDITKFDVQTLVEHIADNSGKTQANHVLERISAIYNKLIDWGYKLENPTKGVRKYKLPKRTRFLSAEELPRFWEIMDNYEHTELPTVVKIALFTGARKANILSMRWCDIDWDRGVWNIPMTKNGEPHTVPLTRDLVKVLRERYATFRCNRNAKWVFPSDISKSGHLEDIKKTWMKMIQLATISNFHFHDLRHTFASYQAMNGSSLKIIGATLGHKSMQSTDRYAQLADQSIRQSACGGVDLIMAKIMLKKGDGA